MGQKDIYIEKLSQQLEEWRMEIHELEAHAENAGEEVKEQCEGVLDALREYYQATEATVEDWIESSDERWDALTEKVEQKIETSTATMKAAISHIRTMVS